MEGNDGTDTLIGVEKAVFKIGKQLALAALVVLDLDGDGVELVSRNARGWGQTSINWDGDGRCDRTGWVGRDDGFLVYDRNGDGTVTNASELSFTSDKESKVRS
jgi:trimeric autotransporter adhesin